MSLATTQPQIDSKDDRLAAWQAESDCKHSLTSRPCTHCGLPTIVATDTAADQLLFCCSGCEGAYQLIHGWGLDQFYALRDQMTITGAALAAGDQGNYERYDAAEFLGHSAPRSIDSGMVSAELGVHGLHCAACSWLIERALGQHAGLQVARVKLSDHTLKVIYDPAQTRLSSIARLLDRLGYQLLPLNFDRDQHLKVENRRLLVQIAIAGFLAANAMWIAVALYAGHFSGLAAEHKHFFELIGMALGATAVFWPGRTFLRGAIAALRTRSPHMDLPIALGLTVGAVVGTWNAILGTGDVYFDGLSALVFLLLIGRWIQFRQQHQAAKAVELMLRVTPRHASLLREDETVITILADRLQRNDKIRVAAGECLPADGTVVSGSSSLNRSLLTGESQPIAVTTGDLVEAGTINLDSPLVISVTAVGKESRIGRVMQAVEAAASEKTPIVQLADRIGGVFVVVVLLLSMATFGIWATRSVQQATNFTTALLVVACPCALAMATPLAIAVGIGRAAKSQILVRDGGTLQRLATPGILWFDKTGTLTEGRQQARLIRGSLATLQLAAAVESQCHHPIAQAIVSAFDLLKVSGLADSCALSIQAEGVELEYGGVKGRVGDQQILVGNRQLFHANNISLPDDWEKLAQRTSSEGETPIFVSVQGQVVGLLGLSDPVRDQAAKLVTIAKKLGWKVGLLSGDLPEIARRVAQFVQISPELCYGGLSPEDKLATIKQSREHYPSVVMIGDGANDAAALVAADVGIAVRGGAEVSLHAAPVYLASHQLLNLARLLRGSLTTTRVIYANLAVSLTYNLVAVALAMTGKITPLIAAILMPLSSLTVLSLTFLVPSFSAERTLTDGSVGDNR